jgi:alkanesulfonate monooxygenase SsuD/methylene tetrahydromethanopterin reductase-like flavin-dependent oxidoreductase (luciferase family)
LHRKRGELLERTFAHICETGAHRRTLDNMRKRYILHSAAANLGLVMRTLFGSGTPRELANRAREAAERYFGTFLLLWFVMAHDMRRVLDTVIIKMVSNARHFPMPNRSQSVAYSTGC